MKNTDEPYKYNEIYSEFERLYQQESVQQSELNTYKNRQRAFYNSVYSLNNIAEYQELKRQVEAKIYILSLRLQKK